MNPWCRGTQRGLTTSKAPIMSFLDGQTVIESNFVATVLVEFNCARVAVIRTLVQVN